MLYDHWFNLVFAFFKLKVYTEIRGSFGISFVFIYLFILFFVVSFLVGFIGLSHQSHTNHLNHEFPVMGRLWVSLTSLTVLLTRLNCGGSQRRFLIALLILLRGYTQFVAQAVHSFDMDMLLTCNRHSIVSLLPSFMDHICLYWIWN